MSTSLLIFAADIKELALHNVGERLSRLRIVNPTADSAILRSMERYGQIMPVVVSEFAQDDLQLLDGFKRLRGAKALGMKSLKAKILRLNHRAGKAALVQLNWVGKSINSMEEALVVHSLFHEDSLSQVEIAALLGRHKSWVCRRIALIDRLCDEGRSQIQLGLLPISMGRELVKLPRGNQEILLESIFKHRLNCRETGKLVEALQFLPEREHLEILKKPWEVLYQEDEPLDTTESKLFSPLVRTIHSKLLRLEQQCLSACFIVESTEFGQFEKEEELFLRNCCEQAMCTLEQTCKSFKQNVRHDPEAAL